MHTTAMANADLFFKRHTREFPAGSIVVEIGSQDVNGSIREVAPKRFGYLGVDFVPGAGVDLVIADPYVIPIESDEIDIVVTSSCFEHSEMFWLVFLEIARIVRPGGLIYLNVPSNGPVHRYPVDCWRFYPDAGKALVTWARRMGYPVTLVESYISRPQVEIWEDFVAVFKKDL